MTTIPYVDFGGRGPVLHFAHSNGYPPECFQAMVQPLLANYHILGLLHRPLWPGSLPDQTVDWDVVADDLIRFCDQEALKDIVGIGHSLGAVASMMAAIKRPELFRALVLIEPVFLPGHILDLVRGQPELMFEFPLAVGARKRRRRWDSRQAAFDRFRDKDVFQRWSDAALWDYVNGSVVESEDSFVLRYSPEWEAHFYTLVPTEVWEDIPRIAHPTLAIRGAQSDTITPDSWQLWQALQPSAQFVEIPDAGHMVPLEQPEAVSQIILDFLTDLGD